MSGEILKKEKSCISARRNFFGGVGSEVHQGRAFKGSPRGGFRGVEPPYVGKVFKEFVKKQLKFYNFLKISKEISLFFKKIYRIFGGNLDKNLEMCICRGFGGEPPSLANLYKSEKKNQWKPAIFRIVLMEILPFFYKFLRNLSNFSRKLPQ